MIRNKNMNMRTLLLTALVALIAFITVRGAVADSIGRDIQVRTYVGGDLKQTYVLRPGEDRLPPHVRIGKKTGENVEDMRVVGPWPEGVLLQQRFISVWELRDPKKGRHIWLKNWQKPASEWITLYKRSETASFPVESVAGWIGRNQTSFPAFEKQQLIEAIEKYPNLDQKSRTRWLGLARNCPVDCGINVSHVEFRMLDRAGNILKLFRVETD